MQTRCVCCDVGTDYVKYFGQFSSFPSTLSAFNQEEERALLGSVEQQQRSIPCKKNYRLTASIKSYTILV